MRLIATSGIALLVTAACAACTPSPSNPEAARWERQARGITIVRDDWGIAHVSGKTDADAVFGMIYAQAEDDFNRIETNYLNALGRRAEAEGDSVIYSDLRMKLFIDPDSLKAQYAASPEWLRTLMDAWADGLNYFLSRHPEVKPRVIRRFEPWMALSFSEGSIGGDIEDISLEGLEAFYGGTTPKVTAVDDGRPAEPTGSNGIAIAPSNTVAHHALLLINPHTSFFFRAELQMSSREGLDAYGAVTWGQFFVYQGFNQRAGWMHTSSGADVVDEYAETVTKRGDSVFYRYGKDQRPMVRSTITVPYRTDQGIASRVFTVYRTHHGPVVREAGGKWISVRLMQEPVRALTESWQRTKARDYKSFRASVELRTNSSNNTLYADADGNIAYFHASFVPKRDPRFNWNQPVDGSDPATEWQGLTPFEERPNLLNPPNGWVYNTNNWPYSAAGPNSPRKADFPAYMETYLENPRGIHVMRLLEGRQDFTVASLREAAYDSWLPAFADLVPGLVKAWDALPASHPLKVRLAEQIKLLRGWDYRWSASSVPTALAVYWGEELWRRVHGEAESEDVPVYDYMAQRTSGQVKLEALAAACDTIVHGFGTWTTPWGAINRFQRLTDDIVHPFSDSAPSIPVGFTSSRWGSLASFGARPYKGSAKIYGTNGNSFVAVVEFGDSVRAIAVTAGGESGNPASKHFNDQALRYSTGDLRPVYFYPSQLKGHTEREYHPGG